MTWRGHLGELRTILSTQPESEEQRKTIVENAMTLAMRLPRNLSKVSEVGECIAVLMTALDSDLFEKAQRSKLSKALEGMNRHLADLVSQPARDADAKSTSVKPTETTLQPPSTKSRSSRTGGRQQQDVYVPPSRRGDSEREVSATETKQEKPGPLKKETTKPEKEKRSDERPLPSKGRGGEKREQRRGDVKSSSGGRSMHAGEGRKPFVLDEEEKEIYSRDLKPRLYDASASATTSTVTSRARTPSTERDTIKPFAAPKPQDAPPVQEPSLGGGIVVLPKGTFTKLTLKDCELQGRPLGSKATLADLKHVVFGFTQEFSVGDVVLVGRTRGGLCYGRIDSEKQYSHCYHVPEFRHTETRYRISLGGATFKELPSMLIGRLPETQNEDENDLGEEKSDKKAPKVVGRPASYDDLGLAVYAPSSSFNEQEVCLVPRSTGGFSYGKVVAKNKLPCPPPSQDKAPTARRGRHAEETEEGEGGSLAGPAHAIIAYRIEVSGEGKTKTLPAAALGKLYVSEALPVQTAPPESPLRKSTTSSISQQKQQQQKDARQVAKEKAAEMEVRISEAKRKEMERQEREKEIRLLKQEKLKQLLGMKGDSEEAALAAAVKERKPAIIPKNFASDDESSTSPQDDLFDRLVTNAPKPKQPVSSSQDSDSEYPDVIDFSEAERRATEGMKQMKLSDYRAPVPVVRSASSDVSHPTLSVSSQSDSNDLLSEQPAADFYSKAQFADEATAATTKALSGGLLRVGDGVNLKTKKPTRREDYNRAGGVPSHVPRRDRQKKNQLIVIDAPNVARKHGMKTTISIRGLSVAINYFKQRGFDVVSFMPEHYATRKPGSEISLGDYAPVADDLEALKRMVERGEVVLTPSWDYDDSYTIKFAQEKDAVIVSNDRYHDWVEKQPNPGRATKWIRTHTISFTFVRDDFMPNPDFVFPKNYEQPQRDELKGDGESD